MNYGIDQDTHGSSGTDPESPSITDLLGSKAVLPGESIDEYKKARRLIIKELVAKSPMQLYLAEKILDGLWWMRRYEDQKRFVIVDAMVDFIVGRLSGKLTDERRPELMHVVLNEASSPWLADVLKKKDLTIEFVRDRAMAVKQGQLLELDRLIAMKAKELEGLQRSYEHVTHRKLYSERLALSVEMMRRDVKAIEVKTRKARATDHELA